jgi:hypothetical protein
MAKVTRQYSRDFKPHGDTGRAYTIARIPAGFWTQVQDKARREGISLRALILGFLQDWLAAEATPAKKVSR